MCGTVYFADGPFLFVFSTFGVCGPCVRGWRGRAGGGGLFFLCVETRHCPEVAESKGWGESLLLFRWIAEE